ncbi:MAG: radical SAM protein [Chitinophagaceae bacterium]
MCDSACKHCLIWAKRPVKFLPFEKIKEVMKSDCVTSHTSIGLEGGEFMLHPEAVKILEWFYNNHKNFDLLSNCLKPDALIDAAMKFPPRHLYVSLDGTAATYLNMRGKPGYNSVIKVIEALRDVLPISVMFTLSPYNDFKDLEHVAGVCKKYGIDMRVGIYNDIAFFDTIDKAHVTDIGSHKGESPLHFSTAKTKIQEAGFEKSRNNEQAELSKQNQFALKNDMAKVHTDFTENIPAVVKEFSENYDFMVLYNEWRKGNVKMRCYSILDSLVILPNGDVPICQSLELKLGNLYNQNLDAIFNGEETQKIQDYHVHNCNQCWLNFHRKYDVILYRTFEKYFGRSVTSRLFGYYQWEETAKKSYQKYFDELNSQ